MDGMQALEIAIQEASSDELRRGLRDARFDLSLTCQGELYRVRMWAMEQAINLMAAQPEEMRGFVLGDFADQLVEYATSDRDA